MSTYPPRKCGIATFTRDLANGVESAGKKTKILAINEPSSDHDYPEEVFDQIRSYNYEDYLKSAKRINEDRSINSVCIQHEFGIFNGEQSCHPLPFLDKLKKPSFVTFHSVFPEPSDEVRSLVRSIAKRVKAIVVMTETGKKILKRDYSIETPIYIIPHGIPNTNFESQYSHKSRLGITDRTVVSSFGMVGPGKGYEYVIESLRQVVKRIPNIIYIIVGATHPGVIEEEGESYRDSLVKKIQELGLENNVAFHNDYVSLPKIIEYIKASDVFISSNQNPEQITSGTLAYAMGCGRAIISTPYPHAQDVIRENNGMIVDYENADEYANAIISLLSNQNKLRFMEKNNYQTTRSWIWNNVGKAYVQLIEELTQHDQDISQTTYRFGNQLQVQSKTHFTESNTTTPF